MNRKKQAQNSVKEEATRCNQFYVNERWLGGMLTNFDVIADVAAKQNYIHPDDVARLIQFRNNPSDESWIGGKN